MTDKIQQARRAAFEEWLRDGQYAGCVSDMWLGFNAALDCVVIELPVMKNSTSYYDGGDVHDSAVNQCRAAIESTNLGIKVK